MTKYINPALIVIGVLVFCYSCTLKQYTNKAAYQNEYNNIDRATLGREKSSQVFYAIKEKYSTSKHRIQDYGITLFLLGWILLGITKNNWSNVRSPDRKVKLVLLGYGAALLTMFGSVGDLLLQLMRGNYPHWADSLGIPLSGFPLLTVLFFLMVTPFMLGMVGRFKTNEKILIIGFRNYQWFYWGAIIFTSLLLIVYVAVGFFWMVVPIMMWLYFCFSIQSGRNSANKAL